MKSILIAGLIALATPAFCQENANQKAIEHQKTLGYFGSFDFKPDTKHNVSVVYSFTPRVPDTEVNYMLYTATPRPLSFKIFNASGKMVKEFQPTQEQSRHTGTLDVSDLPKGKYEYRVYWGTDIAHKISFDKK